MRVFITGASGFIGSHVAHRCLERGFEVLALAEANDPLNRLGSDIRSIRILRGDLAHVAAHGSALSEWRPDVCIHLAWYTDPSTYLQSPENAHCLEWSLALLEAVASAGCRRWVATGTCAEYDLGGRERLREDSPTRPATPYGKAKLALADRARAMATSSGATLAWARIFQPYGPGEDGRRLVPSAIQSLLAGQPFPTTTGEQVRDFIHVRDVAGALVTLAELGCDGIFNVSLGTPVAVREVLSGIGDITGRRDLLRWGARPRREWEPGHIWGETAKLRGIGWTPEFSLAAGLKQTIEWWRGQISRTGLNPENR